MTTSKGFPSNWGPNLTYDYNFDQISTKLLCAIKINNSVTKLFKRVQYISTVWEIAARDKFKASKA